MPAICFSALGGTIGYLTNGTSQYCGLVTYSAAIVGSEGTAESVTEETVRSGKHNLIIISGRGIILGTVDIGMRDDQEVISSSCLPISRAPSE